MKPGEIYLASFPFGDSPGMKLRPVLLLTAELGSVPEVLVAYISSVMPPVALATDISLDPSLAEYRATNLKKTSVLRLHKLATVHARSLLRYLGGISPATRMIVADKLRTLLNV